MESSEAWKALQEATVHSDPRFWSKPRPNWRQEATITCGASVETTVNFDPCEDVFVFDIFDDPCELNNLASSKPELREALLKKLAIYRLILSPRPSNAEIDERGPSATPRLHLVTLGGRRAFAAKGLPLLKALPSLNRLQTRFMPTTVTLFRFVFIPHSPLALPDW
ncbi:hypothetical protein MTO96_033909 [Rhipicephalus appendiculatus]